MASQCKRQQCTIDRRGFRQELDSWRHKLIHCVGFESILEGLFGPELVQDLKLFKDFEPSAVSDWSFDENCLFCCLRRDKVKEHLIGLGHEGLEDTPKPLQIRDQTTISRLEKQAEEFLHAVLSRKDVPNFSDPHIPVVAREILQRMIKQFAAEYTSKTSSSQDSCSDSQPLSDQSRPTLPLISGATPSTSPAPTQTGPAHNQNPVLSKLLMADQDAPLDLTIKKPLAMPSDQDGVLDLSIKKNRHSNNLPVRSPCLSPATPMIKGESQDFHVTKAKDLQSTSTLEQFMAKLCPHHQRQIVDAIGFLQTEVKALASSNMQQDSISSSRIKGITCSTPKSSTVPPEKSFPELLFTNESTPKTEVQDMSHAIRSSCAMIKSPENMVSLKTSAASPALDLRSPGSGSNENLVAKKAYPGDAENNRHVDHAPLKMKIMTSNVAAGKRLSCVLNSSLSSHSDTFEDREVNKNSTSRTETHSARLSSSIKRHSQSSDTQKARQRETLRHDSPTKPYSVHVTIPPDSPRTARKTVRTSDHQDSAYRSVIDPDLGHCDIVFIDKPITECFKERQSTMVPRRNARKSTRGHIYCDEIWELKTVRTLAGRGNCPNPMPELVTLVTPKQILSKPEGVPPVDMPFAGACRETMIQQMSTEQSDQSVIPGTGDMVEGGVSEVDTVVETSQTGQCQSKVQSVPPSPNRSLPTESQDKDLNTNVQEHVSADLGITTECEETFGQAEKDSEPEPAGEICESEEQIAKTVTEPSENAAQRENESQLPSDELQSSEPILAQTSSPKPADQVEVETETEGSKLEKVQDEQPQETQSEMQTLSDDLKAIETSQITCSAEEPQTQEAENKKPEAVSAEQQQPEEPQTEPQEAVLAEAEMKMSEIVDSVTPLKTKGDRDNDDTGYDVSSTPLDALLKKLPPWRRKRGAGTPPSKRQRQTDTEVVGYVNGRPVSASDRSLRRRSSNSSTSPSSTPVKSKSVSNKNSADPTAGSTAEGSKLEEHLPETPTPEEMVETPPPIPPANKTTPTGSSRTSKFPPGSKQTNKQKKSQKDRDSLESKRQLRSSSHKQAESQELLPVSDAAPSTSSPKSAATRALSFTENLPAPPLPPSLSDTAPLAGSPPSPPLPPLLSDTTPLVRSSPSPPPPLPLPLPDSASVVRSSSPTSSPPPLSVTTPPVSSSPSAAAEQPEQNTPQETTVESNIEKSQPLETTSEELQENNEENVQAEQRLRSDKAVLDEKQAPSAEESSLLENESPAKTEMQSQAMPLKSKRVHRKEIDALLLDQPYVAFLKERSASEDDSSDKPTRMPLRSESSKVGPSHQPVTQTPVENKKLTLRSQRLSSPSTSSVTVAAKQSEVASPVRKLPERGSKALVKSPPVSDVAQMPHSSTTHVFPPRLEPPKQTNKFLETLNGEENQQLITNLNVKYDKMQRGWVQLDKEGQPVIKYKNKADRQAAIWKSKRRAKKTKSLEHQKYSPVQMLFMKGFNLTSICRWFLESTETKSLVIVKKVNTRLPSETQLCFHSSSGASGTSQGVFPSLQAERLKKHLKKFAIASPVKSNPKSQKLIAKALEQEPVAVKGKEKREPVSTTQTVFKSHSSAEARAQTGESQKSSGKAKNPASARILRKYSNIRGKMQVQQTSVRLKKASQTLKTNSLKRLGTTKSTSKSILKPPLKVQKSALPVSKQLKAAKIEKKKALTDKKPTKHPVQEKVVKAQSSVKAPRETIKKELPKRCSLRLGSPKVPENNPAVETSKSKAESKKQTEAEKVEVEKPTVNKMNASRTQTKESAPSSAAEIKGTEAAVEAPQQGVVPGSADQVLTRSQRKMEAVVPASDSKSQALKKTKSVKTPNASPKPVRKTEEPALTRSGALREPTKRGRVASLPRSSATRKAEQLETPAKRTRTSLAK
ncbi:proteoglycan 4 isoform X1 [Xyrichtys novacula]|uniref:Proteoglycan 4 isoform X1 n=1 Tax=Xyrichtys novacula TaxID=13765 RepID=A0AAV1G4Z2_XYRNO|nr:proteoglycan 4 isoform X1 [Xyrichtys novacula]